MTKANPNFLYLKKQVPKQRICLLQGGTRSGKTFSVLYYLLYLCTKYRGLEVDIVRANYNILKATVWKDFEGMLKAHGLYDAACHNKSDKTYALNNNVISYYGLDDEAKVHGRSRDILFINEGQQITEEATKQLFPRTRKRIIIDYNPAIGDGHWLEKLFEKYPPLITTYLDNPHLTREQIEDIESRKEDPYWWIVYGTGHKAKREGVALPNWKYGDFDENLPFLFGQDFGYSKDPTTLVKFAINKKAKRIYIRLCVYAPFLSTAQITALNRQYAGSSLIVADGASGGDRLVAEMSEAGLNVRKAKKGRIAERIVSLSGYELIVCPQSLPQMAGELNNYAWHDKKSGLLIDDYNHAIDAIGYCYNELIDPRKRSGATVPDSPKNDPAKQVSAKKLQGIRDNRIPKTLSGAKQYKR
jgi:phage terminase large subunit